MDREAVLAEMTPILVDRLSVDPEQVVLGATIQGDLEADSLDIVELVMELEEKMGVKLSDDEVKSIVTVQDTVDVILRKRGVNPDA